MLNRRWRRCGEQTEGDASLLTRKLVVVLLAERARAAEVPLAIQCFNQIKFQRTASVKWNCDKRATWRASDCPPAPAAARGR
jgi:hypothetical protein